MGTFLEQDISLFGNGELTPSIRSAASPKIQPLCVGWIDRCQLTRECLANAAAALQPMLTIVPFSSINDYLPHADSAIDLIVYYVHDNGNDPTSEIVTAGKAISGRRLVIIADLTHADRAVLAENFSNGMVAFLQPQKASLHLMVSALYLVHHDQHFAFDDILTIAPQLASQRRRADLAANAALTPRERSVLELIRRGQSNREISEALDMSTSTVKAHVRNIMQKTKTSNRTQLALNAERRLQHPSA